MGANAGIRTAFYDDTTLVPALLHDHTGCHTAGAGRRIWVDVPHPGAGEYRRQAEPVQEGPQIRLAWYTGSLALTILDLPHLPTKSQLPHMLSPTDSQAAWFSRKNGCSTPRGLHVMVQQWIILHRPVHRMRTKRSVHNWTIRNESAFRK